jgi:hypothetical protein
MHEEQGSRMWKRDKPQGKSEIRNPKTETNPNHWKLPDEETGKFVAVGDQIWLSQCGAAKVQANRKN